MAVLVKNNAYSTLASGINTSATTITVAAGTGSRFPAAGGSDYFYATLINTSNVLEVVKVTSRSTDTLTVVRGQDGTTGTAYSAGDRIELRVTAALLADIRDSITPADGTVTTAKIVDANVTLAKLAAAVQALLVPSGAVSPYAGASEPTGWLFCRGQTISRTTYAALFAAIGTTYGAGDGSTTFALPDLRGRVVAGQDDMGGTSANRLTGLSGGVDGDVLGAAGGAETHTLTEAQLAAHRHFAVVDATDTGVNVSASNSIARGRVSGSGAANYALDGSTSEPTFGRTSSVGSGAAHNNVQPTIILNYIIKT
jgi:microcystin-dependent protein